MNFRHVAQAPRRASRDRPRGAAVYPARISDIAAEGRGSSQEHPVGGALDPGRAPVEDVGVDHRGADVLVAE